jgi:hypothetical protein
MKHILLVLICAAAAAVQTLCAQPATLVDEGYRQMYNLQFAAAHQTFRTWQEQHPEDPIGPASDAAAYLFSEFDRLHILQSEFFTHDQHFITDHKLAPDPVLKKQFEAALDKTRRLASVHPNDKNSQFALILQSGLHSDWLALIEKKYTSSLQEMKAGRVAAEHLLAADPQFYDAWLAVGVENCMLSAKPAPVRWFLRMTGAQTDKATGLEKLRLTAEKGHYLAPFARLLLGVAALRDNNIPKAKEILADLTREFPQNRLYRQELARLELPDSGARRQ